MRDIIPGTYWLVRNTDGSKSICQGGKPTRAGNSWLSHTGDGLGYMNWISLNREWHESALKDGKIVTRRDFEGLNFPDISVEESPVEIEIGKTGRVYTYEPEHSKKDSKTS